MTEQWDGDMWATHVLANSMDSYGSAIITGALLMAEHQDAPETWEKLITENIAGCSGWQYGAMEQTARHIFALVKSREVAA
jgi:hypothetical protein